MILGTTLAAPVRFGSRVMGVRRLGDIEETRLQIEDRASARALDYLVAERQSSRQEQIQRMALEAATKAAESAQVTQSAILAAGSVAQARTSKNLTILGISAVAGFLLLKFITRPSSRSTEEAPA